MKKSLIRLLPFAFLAQTALAGDFIAGANSWAERQIGPGAGAFSSLFFLFIGGMLASLLPCVYPVYPLTASLLRNRSHVSGSKWSHPSVYYAGLGCIYFGFGIAAALSGGAFNKLLRLPETNLALAFFFLLLALSTAGLIHVNLFSVGGATKPREGLAGTFFMGAGAGLLSSSCVGPFVVGILIKIAGAQATVTLTTTLFAALQMMIFGLGLGLPILAIGLFGARLPRSGPWMRYVQYGLGLVILYFSYVYLEKGLSTLAFSGEKIRLSFGGALVLLFAAYRVQSQEVDSYKRMARAIAGLSLVIGFFCLQFGLSPAAPAASGAPGPALASRVEQEGNLTWHLDYQEALRDAANQGKPLFIDFFAHWCANCKDFDKLTASNAKFNQSLGKAVLCKIQDTTPDFKQFQADSRFPELKVGLPFLAIVDGKGNLLFKTSDYTRVDDMMLFLQ